MRRIGWLPWLVVGAAALVAYGVAYAQPLAAIPHGHTFYEVDTVLTVKADDTLTIAVADGMAIPRGSFIRLTVAVITEPLGSDVSYQAHFKLEGDGETVEEADTNIFTARSQESRHTHLWVHVENELSVPLDLALFGFITRPPTTIERFSLFVPWLFLMGIAALGVSLFLVARGRGARGWDSN